MKSAAADLLERARKFNANRLRARNASPSKSPQRHNSSNDDASQEAASNSVPCPAILPIPLILGDRKDDLNQPPSSPSSHSAPSESLIKSPYKAPITTDKIEPPICYASPLNQGNNNSNYNNADAYNSPGRYRIEDTKTSSELEYHRKLVHKIATITSSNNARNHASPNIYDDNDGNGVNNGVNNGVKDAIIDMANNKFKNEVQHFTSEISSPGSSRYSSRHSGAHSARTTSDYSSSSASTSNSKGKRIRKPDNNLHFLLRQEIWLNEQRERVKTLKREFELKEENEMVFIPDTSAAQLSWLKLKHEEEVRGKPSSSSAISKNVAYDADPTANNSNVRKESALTRKSIKSKKSAASPPNERGFNTFLFEESYSDLNLGNIDNLLEVNVNIGDGDRSDFRSNANPSDSGGIIASSPSRVRVPKLKFNSLLKPDSGPDLHHDSALDNNKKIDYAECNRSSTAPSILNLGSTWNDALDELFLETSLSSDDRGGLRKHTSNLEKSTSTSSINSVNSNSSSVFRHLQDKNINESYLGGSIKPKSYSGSKSSSSDSYNNDNGKVIDNLNCNNNNHHSSSNSNSGRISGGSINNNNISKSNINSSTSTPQSKYTNSDSSAAMSTPKSASSISYSSSSKSPSPSPQVNDVSSSHSKRKETTTSNIISRVASANLTSPYASPQFALTSERISSADSNNSKKVHHRQANDKFQYPSSSSSSSKTATTLSNKQNYNFERSITTHDDSTWEEEDVRLWFRNEMDERRALRSARTETETAISAVNCIDVTPNIFRSKSPEDVVAGSSLYVSDSDEDEAALPQTLSQHTTASSSSSSNTAKTKILGSFSTQSNSDRLPGEIGGTNIHNLQYDASLSKMLPPGSFASSSSISRSICNPSNESESSIGFFDPTSTVDKGRYRVNDPRAFITESMYRKKDARHTGVTVLLGLRRRFEDGGGGDVGGDGVYVAANATSAAGLREEVVTVLFDRNEFTSEGAAYNWWLSNKNRYL